MSKTLNKLGITDVVLRDAQQSLFATRLRIDDMLPIAGKLDQVGYWSLETWGGATFDSCVRYLGEDPWDRIRELKKSMPNTPQQMLFRGQNILGYRHYADDVVIKFVERAAHNGVDVFRVFDAMNDMRNLRTALSAVKAVGKHAQGTISYTMSPVHNMDMWIDLGRQLEDMGANSIAIKDMAGLLKPYDGYHLVKKLKAAVDIPIHMHSHATTGLSTATALKCIEAGIDNIDTAISSMSMTYGHSPTEAIVAMLDSTERDTGLDLNLLEEIADYFRGVRKKYARFEGSLRGVDSRILVAQVPGGMLTNMENQLKEQGAIDRFDDVLAEIPRVREDLGYLPLVTPTSQIVGSQSVLNVLSGERYKTITKETRAVLKGEYGVTPSEVNKELQMKVLEEGMEPVTCRPADLLAPELDALTSELELQTKEKSLTLAVGENRIDDVLTYALFPHIGLKFLENRGNPDAFEPIPSAHASPVRAEENNEERTYTVTVEGVSYIVAVSNGGDVLGYTPVEGSGQVLTTSSKKPGIPEPVPLAGNIFSVLVIEGQTVEEGQAIVVLEAMKMETEVCATRAGIVSRISVKEGDAVVVGDCLLEIS